MKTINNTKVAYADHGDLDQDTQQPKIKITSEEAFNKKVKDATEAKEPLPEIVAQDTFIFSIPETVDECVRLAGGSGSGTYENTDVFVGVFNYAASLRQHNASNDLLKSENYQPSESGVDMSYAVAEKVERSKMSPEEKAAKTLGISPEALRAALAAIKGQAVSA